MEGRLFIYNTKSFKKEKIIKFRNFEFSFVPFKSYDENELENINTLKINSTKPVSNFFILNIDYAYEKNNVIKIKKGLIPLKKTGKIWKFAFILDEPYSNLIY